MKSNQKRCLHQTQFTNLIYELMKYYPEEGIIQISKSGGKVEVKVEDKMKPQIKISGGLYDLFW